MKKKNLTANERKSFTRRKRRRRKKRFRYFNAPAHAENVGDEKYSYSMLRTTSNEMELFCVLCLEPMCGETGRTIKPHSIVYIHTKDRKVSSAAPEKSVLYFFYDQSIKISTMCMCVCVCE